MKRILTDLLRKCNYIDLKGYTHNFITNKLAKKTLTSQGFTLNKNHFIENGIAILKSLIMRINYEKVMLNKNLTLNENINNKIPNIHTIKKNILAIKKMFQRQVIKDTDETEKCIKLKILEYIDDYSNDIDRLINNKSIQNGSSNNKSRKKPVGKKPVGKKPVGKKPVGKKPLGKKPLGKKPLGKKPVGKKPVGKKPNIYIGPKGGKYILKNNMKIYNI